MPRDYEPQFFLFHSYGPTLRATFGCATTARIWALGNRGQPYADLFYIEDENGEKVTFAENAHGHAYAIKAATDQSDATPPESKSACRSSADAKQSGDSLGTNPKEQS